MKTNTDNEREFFEAIDKGNVDSVRKLVAQQPELLNSYNYSCFGATPLTSVAFKDDREMIDVLLELGADPNRCSDWDLGPWSPLHSAIHSNKMELVEHLLEQGAEMDVHTAAALSRLDDIGRLLDANPERVSESGGDGCTPLHFAGSIESAQLLLDRGANMEARCLDHYSTPVHYLADPRPEIARYLFSCGANPDIFSAAMAGCDKTVRKLVAEDKQVLELKISQETFPPGPEHDVHNIMAFTIGNGCSPLHAAAIGNHPEMIKLLVELGADPNTQGGYDDASSLHQAACRDNLAAARALIESGANIDQRSGEIHNNTPAGWAIVAGSPDVFCLLMDHDCQVLDHFRPDAQAAVDGKFRQYKVVPQDNYVRILQRLTGQGVR